MKNNLLLSIASVVVGIMLLMLTFIPLLDLSKPVQGALLGLGMGLTGAGLTKILQLDYARRNPRYAKEKSIEERDERNQQLTNRAKASAADVTQWGILGLAYLSILMDYPIWHTAIVVGLYALYTVLTGVFFSRYQNVM